MKYIVKKINGYNICLLPGDAGLSKQLLEHGVREQASTDFIKKILRPGWIVIDIGANLGYYALLEAKIVKLVYAIEPVAESVKALRKSIKLNNYRNIKIYKLAISDRNGHAEITVSERLNWTTMVDLNRTRRGYRERFNEFKSEKQRVNILTLDNFIQYEGIDKVNFVRMDTEGYEVEIIKGADKTLRNMPSGSYLSVEFHPAIYSDRNILLKTLDKILKAGFRIELITSHNKSYRPEDISLREWLLQKGACPQVFFVKT